jgi:hypothetical protein
MQVLLYMTSNVFLLPIILARGPLFLIITYDFYSYVETLL